MGNYPPPPYPPPPGPPYGNDWKYQRRVLKDQARAQRDMLRAQREAYRYQSRSLRRSSILGPLVLITVGIIFLAVQTGHLQGYRLWEWYGRFWPFLLVGAGVVMLLEWAYDQHAQSDPTQPRYRRRVGGGVFTLLVLLAFTGVVLSGVRDGGRTRLFNGWNINQDNWDEFMGDKHESDQTLAQAFPAGATLLVNNPRGDVTISGTSDDNQIHVSVHKEVYTRSDSDADAKAQRLSPNINVNGSTVTLSVPAMDGAHADLTITVPATAATTVTANHGNVKITAIKAPVIITANHGDIELSAITGDITAHINNGSSDVSAHSVTGALTIEGHAHDTTLSDLSGPVTIRGEFFGDGHYEHIRGPIKFHTSRTDFQLARLDGEIEIGSNAELTTSNAVGPLTLTTYSRNITLDRIAGDVFVTNRNGSVDVTSAPPLSNVTIENRNGSVAVTVPEQSSFAYQFDVTNGDIQSDFSEIQIPDGGLQKKTISGTAGKGGSLLRIATSQGDISVKKASILPLPPTPPTPPKLTVLPPLPSGTRESVNEAKQAAREATAEAKEAAKEAAAEAKEAAKEAKQKAKDPNQ
jgi:Putative adhesin